MPEALGLVEGADWGEFGGMEEKQGGEDEEDVCEKRGLEWLVGV